MSYTISFKKEEKRCDILEAIDQQILLDIVDKFGIQQIDIVCSPESIAMREVSEKRGKVYLPFYSFWRLSEKKASNRFNASMAFKGQFFKKYDENKKIEGYKAVPVDLEYELILWSSTKTKCNEITEKWIMWQYQNPNLRIVSDEGVGFGFDIIFSDPVERSLLSEKYRIGEIHRYSYSFTIQAVITNKFNWYTVKKIFLRFWESPENILLFSEEINLEE